MTHKRLLSLLLMFVLVAGSALAQQLSISFNNESMSEALKRLAKVSGYTIMFTNEDVEGYKVTYKAKNEDFHAVIQAIVAGKPLDYAIEGKVVNITLREHRQSYENHAKQLDGTVVEAANGEPVIGATVKILGTKLMTVTDADGRFHFDQWPRGAVLIVSYIGMETANVKAVENIQVKLKGDSHQISEVVVNGAFTRKANTYSGAVSTLSGADLRTIGNQNVLQSLKNLDPSFLQIENLGAGSNPNALPDFQMRGSSTIADVQGEYASSANQPLFILDGFETELTKIMDLDMNMVRSVTLLKDATAKAIYGAKAANGVIVVETVRPESGRLRVTYTGSVSLETPDLGSYDLCNATEKLKVEKMAGLFTDKNGDPVNQLKLDAAYSSKLAEIVAGSYTDWKAQPTRVGVGHKHSLYLEGGDNAMQYGVNLSLNNIAGVMKGSDRSTFSGGVTLTYRWKSLQFRNKLTIDYNNANNSPYGTFDQYTKMNPYSRLYDSNGSLIKSYSYTGNSGVSSLYYNPIYNTTLNTKDNSTYTTITENFYAEWHALTSLKFIARFGIINKSTTTDVFKPAGHTDFASTTDAFTRGSYLQGNGKYTDISADLGANWSKEFGKHVVFANGQFSVTSNRYNAVNVLAVGFPNDFMDDISYAVQFAKDSKPSGTEGVSRTVGGIASLNYSYDERYLFDANYRLTGSSETSRNNRWGTFWSVGAGWNLHKESFMKKFAWLNRFKLRASYGYTGSQGFSSYDAKVTFSYYTDASYNGSIGSYVKKLANSDLKWQQKYDGNIGLDITLFDRITGRFDYYVSTTDGMITDVTVPYTTGFSTYVANLGKVENKGWESYINAKVFSRERDYVNVFASVAHNTNTLKEISNSLRAWNDAQDASMIEKKRTTPSVKYSEGCSMNAIWAVRSLGIDPQTGKELFLKKDGTRTYDYDITDQVVCGDALPQYNGTIGFNGEVACIGFSLTASYRWGGQMYNTTLVDKVENCNLAYNVDRRVLTDRWNTAGDYARFKAISDQSTTYPTSRFVEDYNLFSLSTLSLSYDFRNCKFMKRSFLERLKLSAYATDLFNISSVKIERGTAYPFARTFSLSVQATF
ncbi:MAG: SusC/RagA family TonB-linked outer membrane protein [Bacteroidaceae bacterium]|nr:SusC/RagA family TonB-linked outer membrane protein [Bacteroidaceae bacterium]